jgi:hypothetical protein
MPLSAIAAVPLLASLVLSYRASPGTVYIAADSRLTSPKTSAGTIPNDTACKIRVLTNGVVFVGTGNAIFTTNRFTTNVYAIAAHEAAQIPRRPLTPEDVRRTALAWQATVHARLSAKLAAEHSKSATESTTGSTGSFYAATADGAVYGITLRVALDANGMLRNIEEPAPLANYLIATGANEAKQQALTIASRNATLPWPQRLQATEIQTIRRQAQLYGRKSDIGGPIDMIEITPKGPIWISKKPSCP